MMRIALVKPDDLGDFVLALPAIKAVHLAGHCATLFCKPRIVPIARAFLPEKIDIRPIVFPHLIRPPLDKALDDDGAFQKLGSYDRVIFLKRDEVIDPLQLSHFGDRAIFPEPSYQTDTQNHDAAINMKVVSALLPRRFDIDDLLPQALPDSFPATIRHVGLAIGTGFHTKSWPLLSWIELISEFDRRGIRWTILGGQQDRRSGERIAALSRRDAADCMVLGDDDVRKFLDHARQCDLIIGVDGGTAHLCALVTPVVSLFGPSPFRRYCPIGRANRVVTFDLGCAPCCGVDHRVLNACMSFECMFALIPSIVLTAVELPMSRPGASILLDSDPQAQVHFGLSHTPSGDDSERP